MPARHPSVLGDEMLEASRHGVTAEERAEFDEWFGIEMADLKTQDTRLEGAREE